MRKYNLILLLWVIAALSACESNDSPQTTASRVTAKTYILGLASPIHLDFDSTVILLNDYFPDAVGIQSATLAGCEVSFNKENKTLLISGKLPSPLGNLEVFYNGIRHDIPVFASEKESYHFTYKPTSETVKSVNMSGNMNGWNYKATPLTHDGKVWMTDLILNKGVYQYRIWEDDKELMDANNSQKVPNGMGAFNNTFRVGEEPGPKPRIISSYAQKGQIEITSADSLVNVLVYYENELLAYNRSGNTISFQTPEVAKGLERSHIRVFAADKFQRSNDILIPLHYGEVVMSSSELNRTDLQAGIMYFVMVDRFADGNPGNNRPTDDPEILAIANNLGGDISGITQKIEDGYFSKLGINTIWISPITTNAEGAWGLWDKGVRSKFSAYHGYWPTALQSVDNRFGNEKELKELIKTAHNHDMNVILDYVAHHVHENHPLYKAKPEWTTPLYLPDGTMNTEKWDEHRLTTWFDTFLPTWDFSNPEVVEALTDTAMYWVKHYQIDGFRHDATKHISEDFWRSLTKKIKSYRIQHPQRNIFQIGETYGSPELISSYISSGQMDAQFDFNLYDAAVDAFAADNSGFDNLTRVLKESEHYYGSHHLMGNITGNQDRARFISYADGSIQFSEDAKLAGWTRKIENKNAEGFQRLSMLQAFLLTTPGIPCIYYGDEIGMPGGNDPDNRRMMYFDGWNAEQQSLFEKLARLNALRRGNLALSYGDLFLLKEDNKTLVFARNYFGKTALVIFNKGNQPYNSEVTLPDGISTNDLKSLNNSDFKVDGSNINFKIAPHSYEIIYN